MGRAFSSGITLLDDEGDVFVPSSEALADGLSLVSFVGRESKYKRQA